MLRICLWCGILYRVRRDPGDSRRASLKATHRTAGGWKSSRMVAHYSAAVAAEQGAVATYL